MTTDARRKARLGVTNAELDNLEDDIVNSVEEFFAAGNNRFLTQRVGTQIMNLVTNVALHAEINPGILATGNILALGSGTTAGTDSPVDSDQMERLTATATALSLDLPRLLTIVEQLFIPLTDPTMSPAQRIARTGLMTAVANGQYKVADDGKSENEKTLSTTTSELDTTKTERDTLKSFKDQFTGLEGAPNKDARIKGMKKIADGSAPVQTDGIVTVDQNHPIPAAIANIKAALKPLKVSTSSNPLAAKTDVLTIDKTLLSDDAKTRLGLPTT